MHFPTDTIFFARNLIFSSSKTIEFLLRKSNFLFEDFCSFQALRFLYLNKMEFSVQRNLENLPFILIHISFSCL